MKRHYYLNKIHKLMDTEEIKIITGVRRSGKTHLLKEIIKKLQEKGIPKENIIYISLESNKHRKICKEEDLSKLIFQLTKNIENKIYLLLDEIHRVENWEEAINKFKINLNSDIYITSSNSKLLSDINTTPLSRYIQLKIHPFSYKEIDCFFISASSANSVNVMPLYILAFFNLSPLNFLCSITYLSCSIDFRRS